MAEEEIDLDFNKLNIDAHKRGIPQNCQLLKDGSKTKELPEERELLRLSFSGESCPRKSCPCNTKHHKKSTESCTSWSRRIGQISRTRTIIHRGRLKNTSIIRNPVLKLNNTKKSLQFIKLDNTKSENLFKENPQLKLTTKLKTYKKFGERSNSSTVNNTDFKSLNTNVSTSTTPQYCRDSFHIRRNSTRVVSYENISLINHNSRQSCSQQARNVREDITINELASYFENLVHIPKKMSSMAEQMYT